MANATELFNDFKANWEYWTGAGAFVAHDARIVALEQLYTAKLAAQGACAP